ncbi:hypothetical protein [uncultured Meiothermus sp.]|uniref:hypothetical protein n=1 Tax=uncultured Meiothermus sp. TaxID=157471 RepID=UPI00263143FF|nr:hypothetical protein [uncultured Meiothermus sp.]
MADETSLQTDEMEERQDGPTPNGGVYSIAFFRDEAWNPVAKQHATQVEICEFDQAGECFYRTYGHIPRR